MKAATTIEMGRKIKAFFIKRKLHRLTEPFGEAMLKLVYLSRLSKWCREQGPPAYHDADDPAVNHKKRFGLYQFVLESEQLSGAIDYLEFGVAGGESFAWWLANNKHPNSRFVGFDTFTGLPEEFGPLAMGTFSTGGKVPETNDVRANFQVGLFSQTLDPFLQSFPFERRKVIHLDADLYSSTLFVLTRLMPLIKPGDILIFDEFGVPTHEFRAFSDVASAYDFPYKLLGAVNNYLQVALRIT